jgi:hypothetical protein
MQIVEDNCEKQNVSASAKHATERHPHTTSIPEAGREATSAGVSVWWSLSLSLEYSLSLELSFSLELSLSFKLSLSLELE